MKKKFIEIPESFNFCDPADWCDFNAADLDIAPNINPMHLNLEEYPKINASERMKVMQELVVNKKTEKAKSIKDPSEKSLK